MDTVQLADFFPADAVITVLPTPIAVIKPLSSVVAIDDSLVVHFTVLSDAFAGRTVAVSCAVSPGYNSILVRLSRIDETGTFETTFSGP